MSASGGSSLNETSWAISASILTWNVPALLMTIGIIMTAAFMVPWVCRAYLRYIWYIWHIWYICGLRPLVYSRPWSIYIQSVVVVFFLGMLGL